MRLYGDDGWVDRGDMVTGFDAGLPCLTVRRGRRLAEILSDWYCPKGSEVRPVRDKVRMWGDATRVGVDDVRGHYR